MRHSIAITCLAGMLAFISSCSTDGLVGPSDAGEASFLAATIEVSEDFAAGKDHITVQNSEAQVFDPAGEFGGGVLEPGTFFPPSNGSRAAMRRGRNRIGYDVRTTGLPPGAYTNWWVIFNYPHQCEDGCDVADLFNPDVAGSVFWSTGGIVDGDGVGRFRAIIEEGEVNDDPGQFVLGDPTGLHDANAAEVHIIVKYHGPASADEAILYEQTHTLLGSCFEGANAWDFGEPFGVQCFDPQFIPFYAP